jgi:hypothetical protein
VHDDLWCLLAAVLVADRPLPVAPGPAELDRLRGEVRLRVGRPGSGGGRIDLARHALS